LFILQIYALIYQPNAYRIKCFFYNVRKINETDFDKYIILNDNVGEFSSIKPGVLTIPMRAFLNFTMLRAELVLVRLTDVVGGVVACGGFNSEISVSCFFTFISSAFNKDLFLSNFLIKLELSARNLNICL